MIRIITLALIGAFVATGTTLAGAIESETKGIAQANEQIHPCHSLNVTFKTFDKSKNKQIEHVNILTCEEVDGIYSNEIEEKTLASVETTTRYKYLITKDTISLKVKKTIKNDGEFCVKSPAFEQMNFLSHFKRQDNKEIIYQESDKYAYSILISPQKK